MARTKSVTKKSTTGTKKTTKASSVKSEDYDTMKVSELKDLCKERGLSTSGLKAELIKRLKAKAKAPESDEEVEEASADASEEPEPPKKSKASKKAPAKGKAKSKKVVDASSSEDEEDVEEEEADASGSGEEEADGDVSSEEPEPSKKTKNAKKEQPKGKSKKVVIKEASESESDDADASSEEPEPPKKSKTAKKAPAKGKSKKVVEESEEEESAEEPEPPKKSKAVSKATSSKKSAKGKSKKVAESEESEEEPEPPKKSKAVSKKAPAKGKSKKVVEESEEEESAEEPEPPKKSKTAKKSKAAPVEESEESDTVTEEDAPDFPAELLKVLDADVDHYYVTPQELAAMAWKAVSEIGGKNVDISRVSQVFALVSEKLRVRGLGKTHSITAGTKAAPVVKGFVKPKPVAKSPAKKAPPKEEDVEEVPSGEEEAQPMVVSFDEELQVYRAGEFVFDQESKSVVGKIVSEDNSIIPLDANDAAALQEQDMRYTIVESQEKLDEILEKNTKKDDGTSEAEGPSEGDDDGKEEVKGGAGDDAVTNVDAGLDEMLERKAPEITEDMFRRFLNAQQAGQNKADYVAIAKEAGLTDMEGQEIMGNFLAYRDRFPTAAADAVMKKTTVKSSLGAKKEAAQPQQGRRLIKK